MSRGQYRTALTYGAVGATQASDLMTYPPEGFTPAESRARIGHGDQRFETAVMQALTWQIQERSGMGVRVEDAPEDDEVRYNPVTFDEHGVPIAPASIGSARVERTTPDGTPLVTAGTTATLTMHAFGQTVHAPVRVVAIIDERDRKGFAYGTLEGHPLSGEESFVIERTPDGSVWLQVRQFSQPASRKWRFVAPLVRRQQRVMAEKYLAALRGD
ncbi:DUF1990 family protein [Curtobacterium sp. MCBD17_032]|uniref:DUF1990 family protein n=1 Tax=Curtobacterium sp. MCBD17_032 TaxID=2175659 RepID=UPI0021AC5B09|nr:DUF1990 domain-containing protein [Curtobacterium sp. MCBD17_032]